MESSLSFRKWRWVLVFSIGITITGVAILIWPETLYQTLAYLLGGSLMFSGIYKIFLNSSTTSREDYPLIKGGIAITLALILFFNSQFLAIALPIVFGIITFFLSLLLLALTRNFSSAGVSRSLLVSGIVFLIMAISVFFYPETWGDILGRVMGFILIAIGLLGVVLSFYLKHKEWNITALYEAFRSQK